jgi:hypothetical protein
LAMFALNETDGVYLNGLIHVAPAGGAHL